MEGKDRAVNRVEPSAVAETMTHSEHLEQVRQLVRSHLTESEEETPRIDETILIRDGLYCGRRFRGDRMQAVWFCEENELKLYDSAGHLTQVVRPLDQSRGEERRAA